MLDTVDFAAEDHSPDAVDFVAQGHLPDAIDLFADDYLTHADLQVRLATRITY